MAEQGLNRPIGRRSLFAAGAAAGLAAAFPARAAAVEIRELPSRPVRIGEWQLNVVDAGSGPAVLMLHGFPNDSSDWRYQIPVLLDRGYRVIAPDLLGLGRSDKPPEPEHYTVARDVERTLALLAALDVRRIRLVGHDRGAGIAWNIAAHHPELVEQLMVLSVGHPNAGQDPSVEQQEKSWYMLLFQFAVAEDLLRRNDWHLFRAWLRHHPDTDRWIAGLAPEGALTAGLGWYRANRRPVLEPGPPVPDVTVPTLALWATEDAYLLPEYVLGSYRYVKAPWRTERIDGASHFLMLDRPDAVNGLMVDFFTRGGGG